MRTLMKIRLLRLFILNGTMGIAFGLAIGVAIFALDFSGVRALAWRTDGGFLAFAMVCAGLSVTCGSAAIATAVMLLPDRDEDDAGYGGTRDVFHRESDALRDFHRGAAEKALISKSGHRIPQLPRKGPKLPR